MGRPESKAQRSGECSRAWQGRLQAWAQDSSLWAVQKVSGTSRWSTVPDDIDSEQLPPRQELSKAQLPGQGSLFLSPTPATPPHPLGLHSEPLRGSGLGRGVSKPCARPTACDCGARLCDELTGQCICPPRTVPPECLLCQPQTFGCHPLVGCEECNCSGPGVQELTDPTCDTDSGQCK